MKPDPYRELQAHPSNGYDGLSFSQQVDKLEDILTELRAGPFKEYTRRELGLMAIRTKKVHRWSSGQLIAWLETFLDNSEPGEDSG